MKRLGVVLFLALVVTLGASEVAAQSEETFEYTVRTVPATPGAVFSLDGEAHAADQDGIVRFVMPRNRRIGVLDRLELETPEVQLGPDTRARFTRWRSQLREGVTAQFNFEYRVQFDLEDVSGRAIAPDRIDEIVLKSSIGEVLTIDALEAPWLLGTRIVPGQTSLEEKQVFWTVQSVSDSGQPVVNRSQTKFFPASDQEILIRTLHFSARFEVIDAFFGFRTGDAVLLESPNGDVERVTLVDGVVEFDQLARGDYVVTVEGPGMKLSQPVAISREQDIDLKLYSWLDLGLVLTVALAFVAIPLLLGFRARRGRRRQLTVEEKLQALVRSRQAEEAGRATVGVLDPGGAP